MDNIRPIDANKFEVIGGIIPDGCDADSYLAGCKEILDMIDNAPTLEYPKWISVEERLPDEGIDVLMRFEQNMAVGFRLECDWCAYTDDSYYTDCDSKPTHWMPLPQPPKEE